MLLYVVIGASGKSLGTEARQGKLLVWRMGKMKYHTVVLLPRWSLFQLKKKPSLLLCTSITYITSMRVHHLYHISESTSYISDHRECITYIISHRVQHIQHITESTWHPSDHIIYIISLTYFTDIMPSHQWDHIIYIMSLISCHWDHTIYITSLRSHHWDNIIYIMSLRSHRLHQFTEITAYITSMRSQLTSHHLHHIAEITSLPSQQWE